MSRPYAHLRQCFALCLSAVLLAGAVYAGVVKPLCPPTAELKLITTLKSMDVLEVLGVARTQTILSSDLQSSRPPQESENAGEQNENKPESNEPNPPEDLPQDGENRESIITSTIQQAFEGVSYTVEQRGSLWLFLLIPAAIALAYAYRYESRQRWRRKLQQLKPEDAVINLYRFFLARFARLGLGRRKTISLRQYAQQNAVQLSAFDTDEVSFAQLTEIYEKVVYGHAPVSEQELAAFRRYYDGFYPALQREVGGVKYWLTAFKY